MIYYDNDSGFWRWDRWRCGNGTFISEWMVRYWVKTGGETIRNEDIWRLVDDRGEM